ncbi:MAG: FAD-binding protein [Halocynthiibacter sp.]
MKPKNEAELSEMIRATDGPLCVQGGGTRGLRCGGDVLETTDLSGVTLYDPGALTLVAGAGTTLTEVENLLEKEGQRLAFEPRRLNRLQGTSGETTLGGIVATNSAGPARIALGNCADHLLGVRFVNGAGEVVKNGGRVMKNVTGYDLVKLMAGSHGTLGVMSEVSLKVLPRPETEATLAISGQSVATAQASMAQALGSPFEVTGAVHIPGGETLLRIEGFEASVTYRAGKLAELTGVEIASRGEGSRARWADLRDLTMFADHLAAWRISMKPSDAPEFLDCLNKMHEYDVLLDHGGGQLWIAANEHHLKLAASYGDDGFTTDTNEGVRVLHAHLQHNAGLESGDALLVKVPPGLKQELCRFQPQSPALAKIQSGLRGQFDPRGILNSGLMG